MRASTILSPWMMSILLGLSVLHCAEAPVTTSPSPADDADAESLAAPPAPPAPPTLPPPALSPDEAVARLDRGIDVSVHSGQVDWSQVVAAGFGFAILKATEGVDLEDGAFAEHWPETAAAGLVRGAYHFYVTEDDPDAQADWFISKVSLQPGDLAPIVDVELIGHGTKDGWQHNLIAFVRRLHDHYGVPPIVYTSPNFWSQHFQGELAESLAAHPLWIAQYGVDQPRVPAAWSTWHLWQYQGDADLAGVEKGADLSQVQRSGVNPAELLVPSR